MQIGVATKLRTVFNASDRKDAERLLKQSVAKYVDTTLRLATWMEEDIPEGLNVLLLPRAHRRRLATTRILERVNEDITQNARRQTISKRRVGVANHQHQQC